MGSDRARKSYDPGRMYRSVVSQQGRVTVEADANEAEEIRADEARADLIDVVGPHGAPGNGFEITVPGTLPDFDFAIGAGAFYVGGERVTNSDRAATYLGQKHNEWIHPDVESPPLPTAAKPFVTFSEAIYLVLSEQEVSAVEDPALREVALGGPDTAARTRLIQRVQRMRIPEGGCEAALAAVAKNVYGERAALDDNTMRLESTARLRVEFVPSSMAQTDICQPTAQPGFLGPENQLIRVQVSSAGTLLWGGDNASFLYRVSITPGSPEVTLEGIPVDRSHHPQADQWVELLGTSVKLDDGAQIASEVGLPLQVHKYVASTRTVTLTTAVPLDFANKHPAPWFMRVWENQIPIATDPNTALELKDAAGNSTGVCVYAQHASQASGDYWMIGVRPSTPQAILPARLRLQPQPPDGPRRWLAPLAVIAWNAPKSATVTDCRQPFLHLVELTRRKPAKCCELVVSPEAHKSKTLTLQDAIDTVVKAGGGTICLEAGVYDLERTLVLNNAKSVRITGTGFSSHLRFAGGVALSVFEGDFVTLDAFRLECTGNKGANTIVVYSSNQVHIERLRIDGDSRCAGIALSGALEDIGICGNWIKVGAGIVDLRDEKIGATGLTNLRVEDNLFVCATVAVQLANVSIHQGVSRFAGNRVSLPPNQKLGSVDGFRLQGETVPGCAVEVIGNTLEVTGIGILTGLDGMRITDNDLTPPGTDNRGKNGILMTKGGALERLDDAQITGNRITRFEVGIMAEVPLGSVSITRNQISTCGTGLDIRPGSLVNLTINANQIGEIGEIGEISGTAIVIATQNGRITISDNHLQGRGGDNSIVSVNGRIIVSDCLFCQNHVAAQTTNDNTPTIEVTSRTVVLASNRVQGTVALNCKITKLGLPPKDVPLCTVLGNVSGLIKINGDDLATTHWDPLNVTIP